MEVAEAKLFLIDYVINSLDNGGLDEDVQKELQACITLANSITNPKDKSLMFSKHIALRQLGEMVEERVQWNE